MNIKLIDITIKNLTSDYINEANNVFRLAFASQFNYAQPEKFAPGFSLESRVVQEPEGVFAAFNNNRLIAVAACSTRGSVGIFGPVAVIPEFWGSGIGKQLLERALKYFLSKHILYLGLSTFPDSPKHISMYYRYGYFPRTLIASMCKVIGDSANSNIDYIAKEFSQLSKVAKKAVLNNAEELTGNIFTGLNYNRFIETVDQLGIGETLLIYKEDRLAAFAICHFGENSEAEIDVCYIKIAAVHPDFIAKDCFINLLKACENFAKLKKTKKLFCGLNTARTEAFTKLLDYGFKIDSFTVSMHKPNESFYDKSCDYVLDDWR